MSQLFNNASPTPLYVPVREQRRSDTGASPLAATNAALTHTVNGDESALIYFDGGGSILTATVVFEGTMDGTTFIPIPVLPFYALNGTVPVFSQPMLTEAFTVANTLRVYSMQTTGLRAIRVRLSAWTAGTAVVVINSDAQLSIHPNITMKPTTLVQSVTAAVGVAATATLPAVAGLRHYVDFIQVTRSATAVLIASATPVVTTSANLPGAVAMTFGQDAAGIGIDKEVKLDFGATGLAATAINTASSVTCPAYVGVIWRINIGYRLGL